MPVFWCIQSILWAVQLLNQSQPLRSELEIFEAISATDQEPIRRHFKLRWAPSQGQPFLWPSEQVKSERWTRELKRSIESFGSHLKSLCRQIQVFSKCFQWQSSTETLRPPGNRRLAASWGESLMKIGPQDSVRTAFDPKSSNWLLKRDSWLSEFMQRIFLFLWPRSAD